VNCLFLESVGVIDEDACDVTQMWLIASQTLKMYVCNVLKVQLVII
jgi:hypothetical protein